MKIGSIIESGDEFQDFKESLILPELAQALSKRRNSLDHIDTENFSQENSVKEANKTRFTKPSKYNPKENVFIFGEIFKGLD